MILVSLACAPVSWVDDGVTPSWVAYPVLLLVAGWLVLRGRGALFLGGVSLLFLIVHLPFTWAAVSGAEHSPADPALASSRVQWFITLFLVPLATNVVGWAAWHQQQSTELPLRATARP